MALSCVVVSLKVGWGSTELIFAEQLKWRTEEWVSCTKKSPTMYFNKTYAKERPSTASFFFFFVSCIKFPGVTESTSKSLAALP